jgi:hypothetical protein
MQTVKQRIRILLLSSYVALGGCISSAEEIKDSQARVRGRVEGDSAYNEKGNRLGYYRNGKTYKVNGRVFGYGNLLSALVVKSAEDRGVWK